MLYFINAKVLVLIKNSSRCFMDTWTFLFSCFIFWLCTQKQTKQKQLVSLNRVRRNSPPKWTVKSFNLKIILIDIFCLSDSLNTKTKIFKIYCSLASQIKSFHDSELRPDFSFVYLMCRFPGFLFFCCFVLQCRWCADFLASCCSFLQWRWCADCVYQCVNRAPLYFLSGWKLSCQNWSVDLSSCLLSELFYESALLFCKEIKLPPGPNLIVSAH